MTNSLPVTETPLHILQTLLLSRNTHGTTSPRLGRVQRNQEELLQLSIVFHETTLGRVHGLPAQIQVERFNGEDEEEVSEQDEAEDENSREHGHECV